MVPAADASTGGATFFFLAARCRFRAGAIWPPSGWDAAGRLPSTSVAEETAALRRVGMPTGR